MQLTGDLVSEASLVLCATLRQATVVSERYPTHTRKVFGRGDFVARAALVPPMADLTGLLAEVAACPVQAGRDLADPVGRRLRVYSRTADEIDRLTLATLNTLRVSEAR